MTLRRYDAMAISFQGSVSCLYECYRGDEALGSFCPSLTHVTTTFRLPDRVHMVERPRKQLPTASIP